jgi:predicted phage tail protein
MFKQDVAFDELRDQLNTGMPVVSKEFIMAGITNKHQALRHSRYLLENERHKNEFVTYTAGADHCYMKPGDLIYADSTKDNGKKHSGRIVSISSTTATIDGAIEMDGSKGYRILIENGFTGSNEYTAHEQTVVNNSIFETSILNTFTGTQDITQLELGSVTGLNDINAGKSALTDFNGQAFILIEDTAPATKPYQQEKIYKIRSITETSPFVYEVVAQRYEQDKWNTIDEGYFFGYSLSESLATGYTET